MSPPLATIGMTEMQARTAGHRIKVARQTVADIIAMPRADIVEETRGLMKFVIDADTDQILGAALLSDSIYTHLSSTEAFNDVIGAVIQS